MTAVSGFEMTPATTGSGGEVTIESGVTFFIQPPGQSYTLSGTFNVGSGGQNSSFIMEYHASFEEAINLGPLQGILPGITAAFGFDGVSNALQSAGNALATVPGFDKILNASLKITDIVINTLSKTYQFGVALDFSTIPDPIEFAGIKLMSLSFKVTSTNTTTI